MSKTATETGTGVSWVLGEFVRSLSQIVESATGSAPTPEWHEREGLRALAEYTEDNGVEMLWWQQPLSHPDGARVSVGAARGVWADLDGYLTGITADAEAACRRTPAILLRSVVEGLSERLRSRVECLEGWIGEPDSSINRLFSIHLEHPTLARPLIVLGMNRQLLDALGAFHGDFEEMAQIEGARKNANLDALREIEVPVVVTLGRVRIAMKDALKLGPGSIVELDCMDGELVEVSVGNSLIARGGIVVIDGNYGVRIEEILSARQRPGAEAFR